MTMLRPGWPAIAACAKSCDLLRLADIDAVYRDFCAARRWPISAASVCQSGLVAIGQRQVAAARGKLQRQRPADATGRTGDGSGGSTDRGHLVSSPCSGRGITSYQHRVGPDHPRFALRRNQKAGSRPAVLVEVVQR